VILLKQISLYFSDPIKTIIVEGLLNEIKNLTKTNNTLVSSGMELVQF